VLIYQKSDIQKYKKTHASIFRVKNILRYFLKEIHTQEVHHRILCKAENGDIRRKRGAQISYPRRMPSNVTRRTRSSWDGWY